MPIYEYECEKCGEKFEDFRWPNEDEKSLKFPKCGAEKPKRKMSSANSSSNSCETRSYG
jgi:putative FmdB family regulatory protein